MVKKRNLAFNNWSWSEAMELTLSDSMSIVSGSKLEFRVLLLAAGRKPNIPEGNRRTTNQLTCEVSSGNRTQATVERYHLLLLLTIFSLKFTDGSSSVHKATIHARVAMTIA